MGMKIGPIRAYPCCGPGEDEHLLPSQGRGFFPTAGSVYCNYERPHQGYRNMAKRLAETVRVVYTFRFDG
jgi:hypothetical protein